MKIGIATYHRAHNYGAVLQAIALRNVIEKMGHEAVFVDYWPKYHESKYKMFSWYKIYHAGFREIKNYLAVIIKYYKDRKRRIEKFEAFFRKYTYPYCQSVNETYDVVIYGSDQIWRRQREIKSYNPFYFGANNLKTAMHISYAASMGNLPKSQKEGDLISRLVKHLKYISVRENDLKAYLIDLGVSDVRVDIDPTLLISQKEWEQMLTIAPYVTSPYALVYIMGGNGFNLSEVEKFAKARQLKLIVLRGYANTKETDNCITTADPSEFLSLIKGASYVFSSSFHGVAFSVIFRKPFYASFLSNEGRARSLMEMLGIENRLLPPRSVIPNVADIDYTKVDAMLSDMRQKSLQYFKIISK